MYDLTKLLHLPDLSNKVFPGNGQELEIVFGAPGMEGFDIQMFMNVAKKKGIKM